MVDEEEENKESEEFNNYLKSVYRRMHRCVTTLNDIKEKLIKKEKIKEDEFK